jgi:hypothetical protein
MVARDQHAPFAVFENRVARAVPGPVVHGEDAVTQTELLAVAQRPGHVCSRPPSAKRLRHRLQRAGHVRRDPMSEHDLAGEVVVGLGLLGEPLHEGHGGVDGRDLGSRARGHEADEAQVVDVLVREDHQLDVLE